MTNNKDKAIIRELAAQRGGNRRVAGAGREAGAVAQAQRTEAGTAHGDDRPGLLERDERRRRADPAVRRPRMPRLRAAPPAHALPVEAFPRGHGRGTLHPRAQSDPQHRLRHRASKRKSP